MQQHYADVLLLLPRSSVTHQRSNTGVHMTNDGSPGYDQGRERREEDLDTRGEEADRHPSC
jgi:hypothetical protein